MSMYPTTGAALINAFNASLFDSCKSAGWQALASALADKWPELEAVAPNAVHYDQDRLCRVDWATQAGMTAGLLRVKLKPAHYHVLKMRYTHDGENIDTGNDTLRLAMTDNTRTALIEGWLDVRRALVESGAIRKTVVNNAVRFQYLTLRALRPELVKSAYQASGSEQQATVNKHQCEVKKAVRALLDAAHEAAELELKSALLC
ncbi:hypothetical protein [Kistimonas asteriae]|uniref:hypothetical protein n=1 Tax=Kistimonas asteriae TaxID=517724 RepID=UPI001BA66BBA|nr:hypothetical protein [Kistimonas asteriae]